MAAQPGKKIAEDAYGIHPVLKQLAAEQRIAAAVRMQGIQQAGQQA